MPSVEELKLKIANQALELRRQQAAASKYRRQNRELRQEVVKLRADVRELEKRLGRVELDGWAARQVLAGAVTIEEVQRDMELGRTL